MWHGVVRAEPDTDLPQTSSQSGNGASPAANQDEREVRAESRGREGMMGREGVQGEGEGDGEGQGAGGGRARQGRASQAPERGQPAWPPADTLAEENGK